MSSTSKGGGFRHGLSFLGIVGLLTGFFGARVFATLNPNVVVVQSGIHFHHFWYGLALLALSGWLGIVRRSERLDRAYALMYGLGAGLIGDEVGLLLTFSNYYSELTYVFLVGVAAFLAAVGLVLRFGDKLEDELLKIGTGERTALAGLVIAGLSALFFASDLWLNGAATAIVGILVVAAGRILEKRRRSMIPSIVESSQETHA